MQGRGPLLYEPRAIATRVISPLSAQTPVLYKYRTTHAKLDHFPKSHVRAGAIQNRSPP